MHPDLVAMVCHEANRAYCVAIGDMTQIPWEYAPDWQRESAIKGVKTLMADPSLTPEELHNHWCADKQTAGWVYGEEKDAFKKTHPCLLPYDQLSEAQKTKDRLFQAIVRALVPLPKGYVVT